MTAAKDLSDDQVNCIRRLAEEGATLGEIQKQLANEFKLSMTYLEARLLIGDLGVELRGEGKAAAQKAGTDEVDEVPAEAGEDGGGTLPENECGALEEGAATPANVSVKMSELAQPGMIANGSVTFTDGETADWYVDEMGRLGLNPATGGYRPSAGDVEAFQDALQKLAREEGL